MVNLSSFPNSSQYDSRTVRDHCRKWAPDFVLLQTLDGTPTHICYLGD